MAGPTPTRLAGQFGQTSAMFRALLGEDRYGWRDYDVAAGEFPAAPEDCEAYLVTGSAKGVYDTDPWIAQLRAFLVAAKGRTPMVGVCFGHQIMADAFGGQVIKSPKGWGIGLHTHAVLQGKDWIDAPAYALPASHQDQVVTAPPGATVLGGSDFCPLGMLAYDDARAISVQLHPEFEPAYAQALITGRRGERIDAALADQAVASLDAPNDNHRFAGWIHAFLERVG